MRSTEVNRRFGKYKYADQHSQSPGCLLICKNKTTQSRDKYSISAAADCVGLSRLITALTFARTVLNAASRNRRKRTGIHNCSHRLNPSLPEVIYKHLTLRM